MMTFKEQFLEEMAVKFAGSVLAYSGVEDNGKVDLFLSFFNQK